MNVQFKKKWVEALRSGKFRQCRGQLKSRNGSYCCLGVLCEISGATYIKGSIKKDEGFKYKNSKTNRLQLPGILRKEAGITNRRQDTLINLNDSRKLGFKKIADWIEETL